MFSFNNVSVPTEGIIPEVDGTSGVYLKKAEYTKPAGKTPRIEFHLERPLGAVLQKQTIFLNDYTVKGAYNDKQPQEELDRLFSLVQTYNPDKSREELSKLVGEQETWEGFCNAVIAQLPPNYPEIKSSWFLCYRPGTDLLSIPKYPPFVKLGDAQFKSNPAYHSFVPTKREIAPSGLGEFVTDQPTGGLGEFNSVFQEDPAAAPVDKLF